MACSKSTTRFLGWVWLLHNCSALTRQQFLKICFEIDKNCCSLRTWKIFRKGRARVAERILHPRNNTIPSMTEILIKHATFHLIHPSKSSPRPSNLADCCCSSQAEKSFLLQCSLLFLWSKNVPVFVNGKTQRWVVSHAPATTFMPHTCRLDHFSHCWGCTCVFRNCELRLPVLQSNHLFVIIFVSKTLCSTPVKKKNLQSFSWKWPPQHGQMNLRDHMILCLFSNKDHRKHLIDVNDSMWIQNWMVQKVERMSLLWRPFFCHGSHHLSKKSEFLDHAVAHFHYRKFQIVSKNQRNSLCSYVKNVGVVSDRRTGTPMIKKQMSCFCDF